jgi:hypothetical protein
VDRVSGGTGKAGLREGALPVPVWEQRYRLWQRRLLFFLVVLEECFVRSLTWRTLGRPFCCLLFGYDEREGGGGGARECGEETHWRWASFITGVEEWR